MTYTVSSGTLNPTQLNSTVVPNFIYFTATVAKLAHGENRILISLSHSPSLFDARGFGTVNELNVLLTISSTISFK